MSESQMNHEGLGISVRLQIVAFRTLANLVIAELALLFLRRRCRFASHAGTSADFSSAGNGYAEDTVRPARSHELLLRTACSYPSLHATNIHLSPPRGIRTMILMNTLPIRLSLISRNLCRRPAAGRCGRQSLGRVSDRQAAARHRRGAGLDPGPVAAAAGGAGRAGDHHAGQAACSGSAAPATWARPS